MRLTIGSFATSLHKIVLLFPQSKSAQGLHQVHCLTGFTRFATSIFIPYVSNVWMAALAVLPLIDSMQSRAMDQASGIKKHLFETGWLIDVVHFSRLEVIWNLIMQFLAYWFSFHEIHRCIINGFILSTGQISAGYAVVQIGMACCGRRWPARASKQEWIP